MSNLPSLKKKRGTVKKRLTDFYKYISDKDSEYKSGETLDRRTIIELEGRLERINHALDLFYEINAEIEEIDSSDVEKEQKQFEDDFYASVANAKLLIEKNNSQLNPSSPRFNDISQVITNEMSSVKLPTIHLPKFKGVHTNWLEFRDIFHSMIHKNDLLTKVQKFYSLKSSLEGEALDIIQSIKMSHDNYDIAWSLLCDRFHNKRLLVQNHVRALYTLESIPKESSISLRHIVNNINHHLRSLNLLDIKTDTWDPAIIFFVTAKLDSVTAREWESQMSGTELPTLNELLEFLKNRADMLDNLKLKVNNLAMGKCGISLVSNISCYFCKASHSIYKCEDFKALPVEKRLSEAKRLKLCVNCLRPGHINFLCSELGCRICKYKHNSLLHLKKKEPEVEPTSSGLVAHASSNNFVLLSTSLIKVRDKHGKMHIMRALLDSGSQSCFITETARNKLQIKCDSEITGFINGINNTQSNIKGECKIFIQSTRSSYSDNINCYILPQICNFLPQLKFDVRMLKLPFDVIENLADPKFNVPNEIDILLGVNLFSKIMTGEQIDLGKNFPTVFSSQLGWILSGPIPLNYFSNVTCNVAQTVVIQQQLSRFWELEEILEPKPLSDDEIQCERHFVENHTRDEQGRFIVRIPLKYSIDKLGNSNIGARSRFHSLERKFVSNSLLKELYCNFMHEYQEMNHMTLVSPSKLNAPLYFLPHHSVLREHSKTTRLRVVFDASYKTDSGYSRNDIEYVGPVIQNDLLSILIRFRQHPIAISADIKKMYRQVLVHPNDRHLQMIFWRREERDALQIFQLNTVTYGTASGSYLSTRCLHELAKLNVNMYPEASNVISNDFYVDDLLTGADDIEKAKLLISRVNSILADGCFELDKWASNDAEIFTDVGGHKNDFNRSISISDFKSNTKVLGLHWSPSDDFLFFQFSSCEEKSIITKRIILSTISQIFDPLGLLAACLIIAKIILQQLWAERVGWDDEVSKEMQSRWINFSEDLLHLNNLRIPRYVLNVSSRLVEIHGFADASEKAYAACVYIRCTDESGKISTRLVSAKSKVAPIKTLTIPKLELCAAVLLSKLTNKILSSLRLHINETHLWTDSTVVLGWLGQPENVLKIFVAHRVAQIRTLVGKIIWKHVPSEDNPADLASRGVLSSFIVNSNLWWHGPHWLCDSSSNWPQLSINGVENLPEMKVPVPISLIVTDSSEIINFKQFSTFIRLQKTVAYVLRFLNNCKRSSSDKNLGCLDSKEMHRALLTIVKIVQASSFSEEIREILPNKRVSSKSKILALTPFFDEEQILRVGGRLENSELTFESKHPVILPTKNYVVDLIFKYEHIRLGHAGPTQLLCSIRDKFWPIKGKNVAKRIVRNCVRCFRARPFNDVPLMGPLPASRVTPKFPFQTTGIDYAGPFLIKNRKGRGAKISKCYISLFVCFCTKAAHIEITSDYTSEAFLASLKRFIARRGKPSDIYSDNAKNFVGAKNELERLIRSFETEPLVASYLSLEGINWHFIPPYSPHLGGIWEAAVRKVKFHLKRMLGTASLTFEEFYTVTCQIEAILNSRPLIPLSDNPADLDALTPSHFLIGRKLTTLLENDVTGINPNRLMNFRRMQYYTQLFWRRWKNEYLSTLIARKKWKRESPSLKVGTLVLVADNNLPSMQWPLGRIVELHPGQDGIARVATVQMMQGLSRRAVTKLYPLPKEVTEDSGGDDT